MSAVFLSAGHSNTDSGAIANGRRESDFTVEFRNYVAFYLESWGVPHATDGKGAENWPLSKAVAAAKDFDIAVEFHCNAGSASANGVETLSGPKDMVLGQKICDIFESVLGLRNRGAKPENAGQHGRLAFVRAGGIIVEMFFITSKKDIAMYELKKWVAAKAVATLLRDELNKRK